VGLFLTLRLRSLIRALLSLVPVLVAVGAVSLIGVAFHLKLSPVTAVAGPLVVAVCTEFTSLMLLRFVEERVRGLSPREAMDATSRRTGRAFMVSGMTAIAGVATLGLSSMPLLSDFGVIVAINISVALLSALVVLPPILVWADQRNWVSRGLMKSPPQPYQTLDERYPPVDANGSLDGSVEGRVPVTVDANGSAGNGHRTPPPPPPPPPPQSQPQPVTPGVHVAPTPAPVALWLPQLGDTGSH
jgi:uncharacterized membrane protein YdfJ with MMPL/SSD domain